MNRVTIPILNMYAKKYGISLSENGKKKRGRALASDVADYEQRHKPNEGLWRDWAWNPNILAFKKRI